MTTTDFRTAIAAVAAADLRIVSGYPLHFLRT